jgi:hypothetical protein
MTKSLASDYLVCSISQKSSAKLQESEGGTITIPETLLRKFTLSWSHYIKLMRIEDPDERSFYEIELGSNKWSLKELQRQFDRAFYERLALTPDVKQNNQTLTVTVCIASDQLKGCYSI